MRAFIIALAFASSAAAAEPSAFEPSPAEWSASAAITEDILRGHIRFLADDLLEGRGPGTRGDLLARSYIRSQFQALGLKPGALRGLWEQDVPLVGVDTHAPEKIEFRLGDRAETAAFRKDYIAVSGVQERQAKIEDAELVFVGYGIVAPEYQWNDYKDADLKGKILVMMNNDPENDPSIFGGKTRLYYGRWTYKYEIAAQKGAAGAIIIHTTKSAGYPWQVIETSWTGEQFELKGAAGPRVQMQAWLTEEAARRVVKLGGQDLDKLRKAAESRDFKPVPLGVKLSIQMQNDVREQMSANVLGLLEGSDPKLKDEVVVIMAHHDHLGLAPDNVAGKDRVYNGAVDNASGVGALLALARAFTALPEPPARSVLFAAVAAEEQGLLGSQCLAEQPPVPSGRLAAAINMDSLNIFGRARDLVVIGYGKSSLDADIRSVAAWQKREVVPDQLPDRGFYYRSDQFNLAKIGVPSVYLGESLDYINRPKGWGKSRIEQWESTNYHQPSDEYRDDWDLSGAVEDTRLLFHLGLRVARAPSMPTWSPGDEFEAARKTALAAK